MGTVAYTLRIEPHWVDWVRRDLPLPGLPEAWAGRLMVQLSDLHVGLQVEDDYLLKIFQKVQELQPDLVVYTGDFISHWKGIVEQARRMFPSLPLGRLGTFGILGNHDFGFNWSSQLIAESIEEIAVERGVKILRNELVDVEGLPIAGLGDLWARDFHLEQALSGWPSDRYGVALSHNPDTVDQPGWEAFRGWILSGHTHGGQCRPPFLPPPLLPVNNRRYVSGSYEVAEERHLYINRGLGHLLQARFNVRPEVTLFRFLSQPPNL